MAGVVSSRRIKPRNEPLGNRNNKASDKLSARMCIIESGSDGWHPFFDHDSAFGAHYVVANGSAVEAVEFVKAVTLGRLICEIQRVTFRGRESSFWAPTSIPSVSSVWKLWPSDKNMRS